MTDNRYTDEETLKALEDYIKENEFEYFHSNMIGEYPLIRKSLDIINHQKAEIERLKKEVSIARDAYISIQDRYEYTKAEVCKEFAEKLKEKSWEIDWCCDYIRVVDVDDIDNLLKK